MKAYLFALTKLVWLTKTVLSMLGNLTKLRKGLASGLISVKAAALQQHHLELRSPNNIQKSITLLNEQKTSKGKRGMGKGQ
jgi:hypothetical protein